MAADEYDDELQRIREEKLRRMQAAAVRPKPGQVVVITDATLQQALRDHPRVLIDFWAEWCGPCRMVGPVVEALASEYAGRMVVGKCNTDENPHTARQLMITAIPTLMLFSHGQPADRIVGALPKEAIRSRIERAFF
ncbi:MAG: thioredoxin [Methanomicrobiales archaeon]|nr:thioredoxin [Methanomicrobiales archaeon]